MASWASVAVFGAGVVLARAARPGSLGWILLVLYVAFAGQVFGGLLLGDRLSAFVGAAMATPIAMFVATRRTGPPTLMAFLPAFWLLVPGALGLAGVTHLLGENRFDGVATILATGATMLEVTLGVLLGLTLGSLLGLELDGAWVRPGSLFRRRRRRPSPRR